MELNSTNVQSLLEAGVHFGHQSKRWNPKMKKFIYTQKSGIHIIDVTKTVDHLNKALEFLKKAASQGDVIFVGTKKQAQEPIKEAAIKSGGYFIINRWPGGLLTNHSIIRLSLNKINEFVKGFEQGIENRTKKELILMKREVVRLDRLYGGLRSFNRKPAAIFVVDPKIESIAVREARKVGVPIVGMVDTNTDPDLVDYIIPANDDAIKSIKLIVGMAAGAVLEGNGGKGVKYDGIDFTEIDRKISEMSSLVAEKVKLSSMEEVEDEVVSIDSTIDEEYVPKIVRVKQNTDAKISPKQSDDKKTDDKKAEDKKTVKKVKKTVERK